MEDSSSRTVTRGTRLLLIATALLLVQTGYLGVSHAPTLFYVANVFFHVIVGMVLALFLLVLGWKWTVRALRLKGGIATPALFSYVMFLVGTVTAVALVVLGNTRQTETLLWIHIIASVAAVVFALQAVLTHAAAAGDPRWRSIGRWLGMSVLGGAAVAVATLVFAAVQTYPRDRIHNPELPPFEMNQEAMGGAQGPFFPSSAATSTGGRIPSTFFMTSESCGRSGCHADIHEQWSGSAHRFSSFNNQWYRKSIEYMQEVNSIQSSKWCGGCHDHAVLINGMMDRPIAEILHTPEAQAGLGCNSCHAITGVKGTMGNGGFFIEYPPLHDLAVSENPFLRWLHDTAVRLDPGPHRRVFLKPFHRPPQQAEFCSACHKVHLDEPVNNYRWLRGFNEYDNWQASGVSGQGARSFYYPPESKLCGDCHMQRVPSHDKGHRNGTVHDHSFLAANTAVPYSKRNESQLRRTIEFLQARQVTVDIFAAGPARQAGEIRRAEAGQAELASTFAVGEEAAMTVGRGGTAFEPASPLWGPLDRTRVKVRPGDEVRVDVVVRTRGLGHFFPGGTVDAYDTWLELRATDENGSIFYWSGVATEGGSGPVDESAHFYKARMLDGHGNPIDKRNAWATRAVAYVNLIPPGAADVGHFRLRVPHNTSGEIQLEARLNYRKFSHANTQFSFAGRAAGGEPAGNTPDQDRVTPHWDDREFVIGEVPEDVSAAVREIPDLPIIVMDRKTAVLEVRGQGAPPNPPAVVEGADRERWNDYGIGLLRQGDLKGAERAFQNVIQSDPQWPEGFVNVARARLLEGDLEGAGNMLRRAQELAPDLAKTHYFLGIVLKETGEYESALEHLRMASAQYPRDRVVTNAIGRVLFLMREYGPAVAQLNKVLEVDPEDLSAHYNLMLAYRGLGQTEEAEAHRRLYQRFKADEDAPVVVGERIRQDPNDNRERQRVHEHPSVPQPMIKRESELRARRGEPNVVLPGEAASYAKRVVEGSDTLLARGER